MGEKGENVSYRENIGFSLAKASERAFSNTPYRKSVMLSDSDILYLQNANIVKLQSAARMSGIRWKSGTLDKAGIIARLQDSPSMGRATIACLQRMEGGKPLPAPASSFMDDIKFETKASEARSITQPINNPRGGKNHQSPRNPLNESPS